MPAPRSCSAASAGRQAARVAHDDVQQQLAQARPARDGVGLGGQPAAAAGEHPLEPAQRRQRALEPRAVPFVEMPAAETSTSRSTRCGNAIASSAAMKPPIELPTTAAASIPSSPSSAVEQPRVAGDRDLLGGHRRVAEPGQVERHHAVLAREHRQLLEPVRPAARQPVDEHQRLGVSGVRAARSVPGRARSCSPAARRHHPALVRCASRRRATASARRARRPRPHTREPAPRAAARAGAHRPDCSQQTLQPLAKHR